MEVSELKFPIRFSRRNNWKSFAILAGLLALAPEMWAEKIETHDLQGTSSGHFMDTASFGYVSFIVQVQTADIDMDGNTDVVALADGASSACK